MEYNNVIIEETLSNPAMLGLFIGIIIFSLIVIIILFVSVIKILKLVNKSVVISLLLLIPFGHIIITLIINPTKSFNKSVGYLIGLILLPFIFLPLLAFSDNVFTETSNDNKSINPMDIINRDSINSAEIVESSNTIQPIQMAAISTNQISIDHNNPMQNKETLNILNNNDGFNPIVPEVANLQNQVDSTSVKKNVNEKIQAQTGIAVDNVNSKTDMESMTVQIDNTNQSNLILEQPTINNVSQNFSNLEPSIQVQNNVPLQNVSNQNNIEESSEFLIQSNTIQNNCNIEKTIEMPIQNNSIKTCKSCGTEIPNPASMCPNCGTEN